MPTRKDRQFKVWVKGQRPETVRTVLAPSKLEAILKFAGSRGIKRVECDAVWCAR